MGVRGGAIVGTVPANGAASGGGLITAAVGAGGANHRNDAMLIQSLLNLVPAAAGGPAKLLKVDGLVGPLTIAAIRRFQSKFGFSDGRIDPGGRTLSQLSAFSPKAQGKGIVGAPGGAKPSPLAAAIAATPLAKLWTTAAIVHLSGLQQGLFGSGGVVFIPVVFDVVNTHFHFDREPQSIIANIGKAIGVFNRILTMLSDPATFYQEGPENDKSHFADARMGAFFLEGAARHITIRTQFPDCGPNCQAAMLVHEGAHFCGGPGEINHFAHEFPIPDGQPQGDGNTRNYAQLTTSEALRNAASYAAFAIHAATFQDLRFGLDKQSQ